ncbi:MAG: hypothetical protein WCR96_00700 [Candidatus Methanomethylophilaceae archaeon]
MISKISALSVSGHNPQYRDPKYLTIPSQRVKSLRWWQTEAYDRLKDSRFSLIVAFCGSGKSILQVSLSVHDIVTSNWKQKQLILVPQQHIGAGFIGDEERSYLTLEVDGKQYDWKVSHNFCDETSVGIKERLKAWLLESPENLARNTRGGSLVTDMVAITTHMSFGLVWNELNDAEKAKAAKNLTLRIDEAHHISGVYDQDGDEYSDTEMVVIDEIKTSLGKACSYFLSSKDNNSKLCLTTATPYRGDRGLMLSKKAKAKFETYYLDWIEHFNTLGIENFGIEYQEYVGDPIKEVVANIKAEPDKKHMVVIPATGNKWRCGGQQELEDLLKAIYKVIPKSRVLDLVTQSTQDRNKAKLLCEPKSSDGGKSKYDVIVTCMLGREGTDWCPCSRLHDTSSGSSITLAVQTIGRPFRRFSGKESVKITNYIPKFADPKKGMGRAELLEDRTNALLVCMQMDEMCKPILIPCIPKSVNGNTSVKQNSVSNRISLTEVFGDEYQSFKKDLIEGIESLKEKTSESLDEAIIEAVELYGITDNLENVIDGVRVMVLRMISPKLKGMDLCVDISFIRKEGFPKLVETYVDKDTSIFFGNYSKQDWKVLREILRRNWDENFEKWKAFQNL